MQRAGWLLSCSPVAERGGGAAVFGTGRTRTLSPASLFIFAVCGSLPSARLGVDGSAALLPAPGSSAGHHGRLLGQAGSGRRGPLGPSCRHTGAVCPACRDLGKGCDSSTCTGGCSWLPLPILARLAWPGVGTRSSRGRSGCPVWTLPWEPQRERAELSTSPPKVPGLGTVACAIPTRSRALLVIAAALEEEPAPAAFPRCSPTLRQGPEPPLSFLSPWRQPGLKSLCHWGEETSEHKSSSLGNKSHVCIRQLLACWHKRPWRSVTPGSSRFNQPPPLRLPGGDSQWTPKDPASLSPSGPKSNSFSCLSGFRNARVA